MGSTNQIAPLHERASAFAGVRHIHTLNINNIMPEFYQSLLEYIRKPGYEPVKLKALAKKLGIKKKHLTAFEEAVARAEASGEALLLNGRVHPKQKAGTFGGTVRRISSGDAFIILHDPKPTHIDGDVFVEQADLGDAQSGDQVLIRLTSRRRGGGGRCGKVVEVIERATHVFVGVYFEEDGAGWVQIDGKDFSHPIFVGDPGAKGAVEGDKVVIEIIRFPTQHEAGEAVLTKVLGPRGEPGVDTLTIIHEFQLPEEFPESALEEARLQAANFREDVPDDREDLTGETIVTIDPIDARDFDDAISLTRDEKGHWLLGVHIADVSHFVQPGTPLDREAVLRGNSVYLPTQVIPMLPEILSNGLASLQEKKLRYTMSAFIEYTAEGIPVHTRFARTAIRVTKRFAYEQVMPIIEAEEGTATHISAKVRKLLFDMHELAMLLRKRRFEKGALELELPEIKLVLDKDARVTGAKERSHDASHQIIEEFMLAANVAVATELNDRGLDYLRRVHADPSEMKMQAFGEFAATIGFPIKRVQSRMDLQAVLGRAKGTPQERALNFALLRSLKRAEYSPAQMGHYALAEQQYCHFTSPIRRYPDLVIHRLMEACISAEEEKQVVSFEELIRLGKQCSMTERRAESAERELVNLKLLEYLAERIGEEFEAVITGVERFGFFCRGIGIPAEGLVHISTLPHGDYFDYDRSAMTLVSRRGGTSFRLGDRVTVAVAHVDVDRRELNFRYVKRAEGGGRGAGRPKPTRSSRPAKSNKGKKPKSSTKRRRGRR